MPSSAAERAWQQGAIRDAICEQAANATLRSVMLLDPASFSAGARALWGRFGHRNIEDLDALLSRATTADRYLTYNRLIRHIEIEAFPLTGVAPYIARFPGLHRISLPTHPFETPIRAISWKQTPSGIRPTVYLAQECDAGMMQRYLARPNVINTLVPSAWLRPILHMEYLCLNRTSGDGDCLDVARSAKFAVRLETLSFELDETPDDSPNTVGQLVDLVACFESIGKFIIRAGTLQKASGPSHPGGHYIPQICAAIAAPGSTIENFACDARCTPSQAASIIVGTASRKSSKLSLSLTLTWPSASDIASLLAKPLPDMSPDRFVEDTDIRLTFELPITSRAAFRNETLAGSPAASALGWIELLAQVCVRAGGIFGRYSSQNAAVQGRTSSFTGAPNLFRKAVEACIEEHKRNQRPSWQRLVSAEQDEE